MGTPFVAFLKEIISSRHDIVSALAIFDPCNVPCNDSSQFPTYGKKSIAVSLYHYGTDVLSHKGSCHTQSVGYNVPKFAKDSLNWFVIACFNSFY